MWLAVQQKLFEDYLAVATFVEPEEVQEMFEAMPGRKGCKFNANRLMNQSRTG